MPIWLYSDIHGEKRTLTHKSTNPQTHKLPDLHQPSEVAVLTWPLSALSIYSTCDLYLLSPSIQDLVQDFLHKWTENSVVRYCTVVYMLVCRHGYKIWPQSGSDWPQMGQIREIFRSDSVHFGAPRQNVLNLIWKFPGFVPFGANRTHFGAKSDICGVEWNKLAPVMLN